MAIGAHHASPMLLGGIVPVDDGKLVAMAHGPQDRQEVGAEQGRYADQHPQDPFAGVVAPMRNRSDRGRLAPPRARAWMPTVPSRTAGIFRPSTSILPNACRTASTSRCRATAGIQPSMTAASKSMTE